MSDSITGRDGYLEAQAFLYAIACIQGLPFGWRLATGDRKRCERL